MKKILFFVLFALLLIPQLAFADGAIFPNPGYYLNETNQKAAVFFDGNTETLVISTSFSGDAKNFSWIVPTPSQPEVSKVSKELFTNLETLTQVQTNDIVPMTASGLGSANMEKAVDVLEQKTIGYYDISVLKASDSNALYDWLKQNNYSYPEKGKYILDDYIRLSWTFTAVKITESALKDLNITDKLYTGDISPLRFIFTSDKIVYPLKISGIAQYNKNSNPIYRAFEKNTSPDSIAEPSIDYQSSSIDLYIFSDHKVKDNKFEISYANWISAKDVNNLGLDEKGNSWVAAKKKYYLTKLITNLSPQDMDEDVYPQNDKNNNTVGVIPGWQHFLIGLKGNILWVLIILLAAFFIPIIWQFKTVSKMCRITCWIVQIISFILKVALMIVISPYLYESMYAIPFYVNEWLGFYESAAVILFTYGLPIGMTIFMIIELIYQSRNKINLKNLH